MVTTYTVLGHEFSGKIVSGREIFYKFLITICFLAVLVGLGIAIYFIVKMVREAGGINERRTLTDLIIDPSGQRNMNVKGQIELSYGTGNKKFFFDLDNSIKTFEPGHGKIYYNASSKNLTFLVSPNSFSITNFDIWNVSYTYKNQKINYNIRVVDYTSVTKIFDGVNEIEIQNYLVSY